MKKPSLIGATVLAMAAHLLAVTGAQAQAFPSRLVKVVVPYAA